MYDLQAMIDRIKSVKKERRLSNEALSDLSGVPRGTLSKILGSETKDPQISSVIKISQALGVSADYIIFGEQNSVHNEEIVQLYSSLNPVGQKKVMSYIGDLIESGKYASTAPAIADDMKATVALGEAVFGKARTDAK